MLCQLNIKKFTPLLSLYIEALIGLPYTVSEYIMIITDQIY